MKKKMKSYIYAGMLLQIIAVAFTGLTILSCEKDDSEGGTPEIYYVRVTDPLKSDSLVTHAFMGNTIAVIGENLQTVKELWFNDQKAILNTSFITNTCIIVTVPDDIPETVTNELVMITYDNEQISYPFGVDVPAPFLQSMLCEYVTDGGTAVIKGNYFIDDPNVPLQVFFPGNVEGEVLHVDLNSIEVKVPAGVGVGPVVVKSIYGSSRSGFYFRDDRGIFLDFDTKLGAGWRPGKTQSTSPDGISGNYVALRGSLANDWDWVEDDLAVELWGQAAGLPAGPLFEGDPSKMALKFEAFVVNEWSGGWMQFIFSPHSTANNSVNSNDALARGFWRPWEETGSYITGGWVTVTIPLADFKYTHNASANNLSLVYPDNCGSLTIFVWGPVPTACNLFICVDNVRVVPL